MSVEDEVNERLAKIRARNLTPGGSESMEVPPPPPPVKKYVAFGYDQFYPRGGMSDFKGSFDTIGEAKSSTIGNDYYELVDRDTWQVLEQGLNPQSIAN